MSDVPNSCPICNSAPRWKDRPDAPGLWDSLNARRGYSWESNPWVVVVSFERVPAGGEGS